MLSFETDNKMISVFPCEKADKPVVYLNTYGNEGANVYNELYKKGCADLNLVAVSGLEWNRDMAPWDCPPVMKNGGAFTGGAADYLSLLEENIIPAAEKKINGTPVWRGIAGYSLAGLFAVYSLYKTDVFTRAASVSGSLWFPKIKEFIFEKKMAARPNRLYFSLGSKESKTRNRYLETVEPNTLDIEEFYRLRGIKTAFELNPGNHFQNCAERTARAIRWLIKDE